MFSFTQRERAFHAFSFLLLATFDVSFQVEAERNSLYKTFTDTVMSIQERNNLRNDELERRVEEYQEKFNKKVRARVV